MGIKRVSLDRDNYLYKWNVISQTREASIQDSVAIIAVQQHSELRQFDFYTPRSGMRLRFTGSAVAKANTVLRVYHSPWRIDVIDKILAFCRNGRLFNPRHEQSECNALRTVQESASTKTRT